MQLHDPTQPDELLAAAGGRIFTASAAGTRLQANPTTAEWPPRSLNGRTAFFINARM